METDQTLQNEIEQAKAEAKLTKTLAQLDSASVKLRQISNQYSQLKIDTDNLQVKHDNLRAYEQKAWAALKDKDRELIQREAAGGYTDETLSNQRSFLPKL